MVITRFESVGVGVGVVIVFNAFDGTSCSLKQFDSFVSSLVIVVRYLLERLLHYHVLLLLFLFAVAANDDKSLPSSSVSDRDDGMGWDVQGCREG